MVHATKCWGNSWISLNMKAFGRGPRLWAFELNLEKLQKILPVNDVLVTFLIALTKYLTKACFGKAFVKERLALTVRGARLILRCSSSWQGNPGSRSVNICLVTWQSQENRWVMVLRSLSTFLVRFRPQPASLTQFRNSLPVIVRALSPVWLHICQVDSKHEPSQVMRESTTSWQIAELGQRGLIVCWE